MATSDGTEIPAQAVIVATGAADAGRLFEGALPVPATRTVTTFYHAALSSPLAEPTLLVDTERKILNTVVLSEVSTCSPLKADRSSPARCWVTPAAGSPRCGPGWPSCTAPTPRAGNTWPGYVIPGALPAMPAPHPLSQPTRISPGRDLCGDHRATGSVQGAMASGTRAAREFLASEYRHS